MNDTVILTIPPLEHPLAGQAMTGASMVVQAIADEGVSAIFGYSGGAVLPVYDAVFLYNEQQAKLGRRQLPLIVPANEQAAGFMAAGYSRSTGQVGVALVTSGPGATNMVTPVRDCAADSIPMVVICGQVPRAAIGSDAFQEAPIASVMGAVAKHVFLVTDPEKLEGIIRAAFELARTGRPGPVVVDIPKDVQNWQGVYRGTGTAASIGVYQKRVRELAARRLSEAQLDSFFALLGKAKRPLIYAGGGIIHAGAASELREFSQLLGIPVVTTLMGIGAVDTYEDLSLRMLGMHGTAFANYAVDDSDFIITLGARFDDRVAGSPAKFAPRARAIAQFDIDVAEINKVKPVQWHHVGDLKDSLRSLVARARQLTPRPDLSAWHAELAALKRDYPMDFDRNSQKIQPYYVIEEINRHHPRRGHHFHRRGPAPDVGRAVLRFPRAAPVAHLRQHGHHGLRPAGRAGRAGGAPRAPGHRHRRRCQHPHEHRRARNRHHLQPAGEGVRAEQHRRRHGAAVAEAVLRRPHGLHRQVAAHQGFREGRAGRRLPVTPSGSPARPTCRAWWPSGWPIRVPRSSR